MLIEPTLRSDLLAGQVAIVTGGSRGIGGGTSTMLAANGAHVVIADVDGVKADETVRTLNASSEMTRRLRSSPISSHRTCATPSCSTRSIRMAGSTSS